MIAAALAVAMTARGADATFSSAGVARAAGGRDAAFGVTLTDRYRWLENGKDPDASRRGRARSTRRPSRYLDRNAPPVPGMTDELARYFDRDKTDRAVLQELAASSSSGRRKGEPQAKLYTRLDGARCCCSIRSRSIRPARRRSASVVPNRDASKLAVGIYAQGLRDQDFRIIDTHDGRAIGPPITGARAVSAGRATSATRSSRRAPPESDASQEPHRCYRHRLGGDRNDDELLIKMKDAKNCCQVYEPEEADDHGVRDRRFLVEHDPHPSGRLDRRAADDLRERQVPGRTRSSARTACTSAPTRDAPNWKLMAASYDKPEFARLDDADPRGRQTVLDDVHGHERLDRRRRTARTCCRASRSTT